MTVDTNTPKSESAKIVDATTHNTQFIPDDQYFGAKKNIFEEDPIFNLLMEFRKDSRIDKIDLGIGVYRDTLNHSPIFSAIKFAEQWRVDHEEDKAYIGPLGDLEFCRSVAELALGEEIAS